MIPKKIIDKRTNKYKIATKWLSTKWNKFMLLIPKIRGDIAQYIMLDMIKSENISIINNNDNSLGYDFRFPSKISSVSMKQDKLAEHKYSSEDDKGNFTLCQIRPNDTRYDFITVLLVYPHKEEYYLIEKNDLKYFNFPTCQHSNTTITTITITKNNKYNNILTSEGWNRNELNTGDYGDGTFKDFIRLLKTVI